MWDGVYRAHIAEDTDGNQCRVQTSAEHARGTAALAADFLEMQGLYFSGYISGLLHDCGKFTREFNDYLCKSVSGQHVKKGSVIHTFAGVRYLLEKFHSQDTLKPDDLPAEILAASIGGHHGLFDIWDQQGHNGFEHRLKKQPDYDSRAIQAFTECCAGSDEIDALYQKSTREIQDFHKTRIAAYAKNSVDGYFALGLLTRLITSAVIDADRTDTAMFMRNLIAKNAPPTAWEACLHSIENYLADFPCYTPIQKARAVFSDICAKGAENPTGLYRLDLPTGGGKTLSALRFAVAHAKHNGLRRIFYIAPLLSIIEQNAAIIRSAVGDSVSVLEHHSDVVRDISSPEEADRTEMLQETWDVPMIATTLVQFLETLFSGKTSSVRRFHRLSNSVIIIDEVQSLPTRMLSMFNGAINFLTQCCGATVVLCSATQPAFKKAKHSMLEPKRLVPETAFNQYAPLFRRTEIKDVGLRSMEEIVALADEVLQQAESLLIVCNTKREATELYGLLKERMDYSCFHLSAGMCIAHRKDTLSEIMCALAEQTKMICVSTQVIEAGIDISFGAVIRFSAGLDNVVQAAGRCNRHGEFPDLRPVYICKVPDEKLGSLKEIQAAQTALNALISEYRRNPKHFRNDLASEESVSSYYSFLFNGMALGAQDYPTHGQKLFELLSMNKQFTPDHGPQYFLHQAFRTAGEWFEVFEQESVTILTPFGSGREIIDELTDDSIRYDFERAAALLQEAKQYTVSVTKNQAERMISNGAVIPLLDGAIFALSDICYDDETGMKERIDICSTLIL